MKFVFLMDPLETVSFEKDTTLALMWGAQRRGNEIFYLPASGINLQNGKVIFHVLPVVPPHEKDKPFIAQEALFLPGDEVDVVFVRTDPPFDEDYLMHTWLLDRLPAHVAVINRQAGVRTVNEKVWATQFTDLVPPTFVGRNRKLMGDFIKSHRHIIVKPANNYGGQGIFQVKAGDTNLNVILEALSQQFTKEIILQRYVKAADKGDKRILLLNGEPLGAVLRVHARGDHRNNIFAGGKTMPAGISSNDKKIIKVLKPYLLDLGLYFVGIDMLGDYLIEVNVTSPTCLQEMSRFHGEPLEDKVIAFAEELALTKKQK